MKKTKAKDWPDLSKMKAGDLSKKERKEIRSFVLNILLVLVVLFIFALWVAPDIKPNVEGVQLNIAAEEIETSN